MIPNYPQLRASASEIGRTLLLGLTDKESIPAKGEIVPWVGRWQALGTRPRSSEKESANLFWKAMVQLIFPWYGCSIAFCFANGGGSLEHSQMDIFRFNLIHMQQGPHEGWKQLAW